MNEAIRILVVDDEEGFRFFLRKGLSRRGHEVREASGGNEGLDLVRSFRPDVAFVDLKMPDLDGIQFLSRVKEIGADTLIILMTAYATIPNAIQAIRSGAAEFLTKPFELSDAMAVLDKALEQYYLKQENRRLRMLLEERTTFARIVGASPVMKELYATIERIARTDSTVLIHGESGSGKELVARAIHDLSDRREHPYLAVHCAAIPETLLESELFGHLPGAFTGATQRKRGIFERGDNGTVFLDEISEIPLGVQVKLLRAIQEKEIQPLGSTDPLRVNVRWIAATNKNLETRIEQGEFREDLFFRLNVVPIEVPPLRDRHGDIPILVDHFLRARTDSESPRPKELSPDSLRALEAYPWPGNVRELENLVERLLALSEGSGIDLEDLPEEIRQLGTPGHFPTFQEAKEIFERRYLMRLLQETSGIITRGAKLAGMSRQNLHGKIRSHRIDPEQFKR